MNRLSKVALLLALCVGTKCAVILVDVVYPEERLNAGVIGEHDNVVMGFSLNTCLDVRGTGECPGGEVAFSPKEYSLSNTTDRVAPGHWQKAFTIDAPFTGTVYLTPIGLMYLGVSQDGEQFEVKSGVQACTEGSANYLITAEYCDQPGAPYRVDVTSAAETYKVTMYPWFGLVEGRVDVLLPSLFSPQFNNSRNVTVYRPPSILQNPAERAVNILFLMDGHSTVTSSFALRAGFQQAVLTGLVPADTLLVGVPPTPDPLAVKWANERTYEMTFAECDPSLMDCTGYGPTGGMDLLLDFLQDTVAPAIIQAVGMQLGEVSITGASLGGLTSMYAVATRPAFFQRGLALEGTVGYNFGQLADIVKNSTARHGRVAKSLVIQIGTASYATHKNPTTQEVRTQLDIQMKVVEAFQATGFRLIEESATRHGKQLPHSPIPYATRDPVSSGRLIAYYVINGAHSSFTWESFFSQGLEMLYRPDYPGSNRKQRSENIRILAPITPFAGTAQGISWLSVALITIIAILVIVLVILAVAALRRRRAASPTERRAKEMPGSSLEAPLI